jgi:hypothetical protein
LSRIEGTCVSTEFLDDIPAERVRPSFLRDQPLKVSIRKSTRSTKRGREFLVEFSDLRFIKEVHLALDGTRQESAIFIKLV